MIGRALRTGTSVGCLPEHADHPATRDALALLTAAGVELVTLTDALNDGTMSGALVWPSLEPEMRGCVVHWFIAGHMDEPAALSHDQERREEVRSARNDSLARIEELLLAAGWDAYATYARRTLTPRAESVTARPLGEAEQQQREERRANFAAFALRVRVREDVAPR